MKIGRSKNESKAHLSKSSGDYYAALHSRQLSDIENLSGMDGRDHVCIPFEKNQSVPKRLKSSFDSVITRFAARR